MKSSAYASSAEALDPASFPFHGASLEGNLLCFILFNQPYVGFICSYVVNVSFINTTKPNKATNIVVCFLCAKAENEFSLVLILLL